MLRAIAYLLALLIACGLALCAWMFAISLQPRQNMILMGVAMLAGPLSILSMILFVCLLFAPTIFKRWEQIVFFTLAIPGSLVFLPLFFLG